MGKSAPGECRDSRPSETQRQQETNGPELGDPGEDTQELKEKFKSASRAFRKQASKDKQAESDAFNKELAELAEDSRKSKDFWNKSIYLEPKMAQAASEASPSATGQKRRELPRKPDQSGRNLPRTVQR